MRGESGDKCIVQRVILSETCYALLPPLFAFSLFASTPILPFFLLSSRAPSLPTSLLLSLSSFHYFHFFFYTSFHIIITTIHVPKFTKLLLTFIHCTLHFLIDKIIKKKKTNKPLLAVAPFLNLIKEECQMNE